MRLNITLGFIGFGRMGSALAGGTVSSGLIEKKKIVAFDPSAEAKKNIQRSGFGFFSSEKEVVRRSDVVFLCVKPQVMKETLRAIGVQKSDRPCFVSIAAGVGLEQLQKSLGKKASVVRVMPNTPALLQCGMSAMSVGSKVSVVQSGDVTKILSSVGAVVQVKERDMDAVTALSGSGPAYVFYLTEALIEASQKLKISPTIAAMLARQTVYGAGVMLKNRTDGAAELRRQVTSPGGTTEAAIKVFEKRKLKELVSQALVAAKNRSIELSRKN